MVKIAENTPGVQICTNVPQRVNNVLYMTVFELMFDLHCGGEPARVLISGAPDVPGSTMKEKRTYFMNHHDDIRRVLLQEPRGYPCQNLNIIYFSNDPKAKYGYIILEQGAIYPLFSGHNTICVATALLETGMIEITRHRSKILLDRKEKFPNILIIQSI